MVAPSLVDAPDATVQALERKLTDPKTTLAAKYRVLFSLRNIRGEAAHRALMTGERGNGERCDDGGRRAACRSGSVWPCRAPRQKTDLETNTHNSNPDPTPQHTAIADPSCLFRHDVAFCLGQRQDPASVAALSALLADKQQHSMVRHEAAEALGAIAGADGEGGSGGAEETGAEQEEKQQQTSTSAAAAVEASCRAMLCEHLQDACQEVRETCEVALARIEHVERERERRRRDQEQQQQDSAAAAPATAPASAPSFQESPYFSVDPTPALPSTTPLPELEAQLMDPSKPMYERYQALFALRNRGGSDSVAVLCEALRRGSSALLKHEVAYVLGQMQSPESVRALKESLADASEHAMVRHEAAEALGAVAAVAEGGAAEGGKEAEAEADDKDGGARRALLAFSSDPEPIVAESCEVALDVAGHEGEFEYADLGKEEEAAAA